MRTDFVPRRMRGFTLVELMIVVGIIAVLVAIAVPAYSRYAVRARRTDAQKLLLAIGNAEERYYALHNAYADLATIGYSTTTTAQSDSGYYTAVVTTSTVNSFAGQAFLATATPVATAAQKNDSVCNPMTLTNTGVKAPLGATSNGTCW